MKNKTNNQTQKLPNLFTLACAVALSLSISVAPHLANADDNGQSVNGPVTSGISIPVQTDKLIEVKDVERAYTDCMTEITNDWMAQLNRTDHKIYSNGTELLKEAPYSSKAPYTLSTDFEIRYVPNDINKEDHLHFNIENYVKKNSDSNTARIHFSINRNEYFFDILNSKNKESALPYFQYTIIGSEPVVNDFGKLTSVKQVVQDLELVVPLTGQVKLYNSSEHEYSNFTINLDKYATCLQSKIQDNN